MFKADVHQMVVSLRCIHVAFVKGLERGVRASVQCLWIRAVEPSREPGRETDVIARMVGIDNLHNCTIQRKPQRALEIEVAGKDVDSFKILRLEGTGLNNKE